MKVILPASGMTILQRIESVLPEPDHLPVAGNSEPSENILINSFLAGPTFDPSAGGNESVGPALPFTSQEGLADSPAVPRISGNIQMQKEDLQSPSDGISAPIEIRQEIGKPDIARMVAYSSEQPSESDPAPLVYLDGGLLLGGNEPDKQTSMGMISNQAWNPQNPSDLSGTIGRNRPGIIGEIEPDKNFQINRQAFRLESSAQNLRLRQSRPVEEMMMSAPTIQLESETEQTTPSTSALSEFNSLERQELNPWDEDYLENLAVIQRGEQSIADFRDQEKTVGHVQMAEEPGFSPAGLVQRNASINRLSRMGQSVSRFALPGQVSGLSMFENRVKNTSEGAYPVMRTVEESEGMPLITQGINSASKTALGGGLPQMPLPPSISETLNSLNPLSNSIGQNAPEMAEKAGSKVEQSEIAQMPNIDRLTDQIWQQIQRRLQIERERSRGMA